MSDERRLVYSTDGSLPLPDAPRRKQQPPAKGSALPADGVIRVARERRRASVVTIVHGLAAGELETVGKALRRLCGTGGTTKNGVVELQGDHRDAIVAHLTASGRRVKKAGG
jgi:translation initiation factor 1